MSNQVVVLLSIPGLRGQDLEKMPHLSQLTSTGERAALVPSFPCVTWPVQANMLTGKLPDEHGVVANGFYWRPERKVEMWTAWNDKILAPQIWDILRESNPELASAVWFPMLSKGCGADYVCMPAPIHNPDGSESLWCYTKPQELYGELRDGLGHFPLQHFWGPMANIKATAWIVDSAVMGARKFRPNFFMLYLPHLDYAAQKAGPDSPAALTALSELDDTLGRLVDGFQRAYANGQSPLWLAASEYVITPVDQVVFPNRLLREAGLLQVESREDGEHLDLEASQAWALADHQFSHVFVKDRDVAARKRVEQVFQARPGIAEVLSGEGRDRYHMSHERCGDVLIISEPQSWQAYYWWLDDARAPGFARTVDIHRKPGYDPVELHFDPLHKAIPLDASLIKGSHGAPAHDQSQQGVLLSSREGVLGGPSFCDTDVAGIVLRQFGIEGNA